MSKAYSGKHTLNSSTEKCLQWMSIGIEGQWADTGGEQKNKLFLQGDFQRVAPSSTFAFPFQHLPAAFPPSHKSLS
jgi:hypothetical protein